MTHQSLRILVADDEITARLLMKATLEKAGFEVVTVENGELAFSTFQSSDFDMVMLDVEMPELDGYETCSKLRHLVGDELPIVMVTGMDDLESIEKAYEAGATDFIAKPINWALIGHRVRYLFRSYQVLQDLHQAHARNAAMLNAIPDTLLCMDENGCILDSRMADQAYFSKCSLKIGDSLSRILPSNIVEKILRVAQQAKLARKPISFDFVMFLDGKRQSYYEICLANIAGAQTLCVIRDITERKQQELEIITTRNKLQDTLEAIPDLLFEIDISGKCLDLHIPKGRALVLPKQQVIGKTVHEILPTESAINCMSALHVANKSGSAMGQLIELPMSIGRRWCELSISKKSLMVDEKPRFIVLSRDITERKEAEQKIYRLAYFDTLTGLPNRLSFSERLDREIQRAARNDERLAVLFVDLDGFKDVNDTLGYSAGDLLLQWVADRLRLSLRPMDVLVRGDITGESKTELARLGGDEFTILASQLKQTENVLSLARRVQELMQRPFQLEGREVVLTASIGIAMYPEDGTDAATLLKNADTAMFNAKHHGRSNYQFYSASLTLQAAKRLDLESNLRLALERDEFFLVYQPQFSIANNQIESVEALIRWKHPDKGFISPLEFIPTAEENGLIVPIGDWVLRTACENAAKWIAQGKPLKVAINLSALQFREPGLIKRIQHILEEYKLPPKWLELEVTEGALMEDSEVTLNSLHALRRLDIQIALDDFGTGYSSLSYLKKLPLNTLKIDQSFVRGLPADRESLAIVKTILSLAQNLGYETTAEGIETMEQAYLLKNMGCDVLQGHYFSKAVLAEEIPKLLSRQWVINEFASEDELDLDIE